MNWQYTVDPNTQKLLNIPNVYSSPTNPNPNPFLLSPYKKCRNHVDPNNAANVADGLDHGNGIICRNNNPDPTNKNFKPILTADNDIRDGRSRTFAIGEVVVSSCNYNAWYWFEGTTATCGIPLNYKNPDYPVRPIRHAFSLLFIFTSSYGFSSRHPSIANFCMCDGSVKNVHDDIDPAVYQAQATIDAGELFNDD